MSVEFSFDVEPEVPKPQLPPTAPSATGSVPEGVPEDLHEDYARLVRSLRRGPQRAPRRECPDRDDHGGNGASEGGTCVTSPALVARASEAYESAKRHGFGPTDAMEAAIEVLRGAKPERVPVPPYVKALIAAVAKHHGCALNELCASLEISQPDKVQSLRAGGDGESSP